MAATDYRKQRTQYSRGRDGSFPAETEIDNQEWRVSIKRCCCYVWALLLVFAAATAGVIVLIVLVMKPKRPNFSVSSARIERLKMDMDMKKMIYVSMNMTIGLHAVNPNKRIAISYGPSTLRVLYRGVPVGVANLQGFTQPPRSKNVTFEATVGVDRAPFPTDTALRLITDASVFQSLSMRITGDVSTRFRVFDFLHLPRLTVALDCQLLSKPTAGHFARDSTVMHLLDEGAVRFSSVISFRNACNFFIDV